MTKKFPGMPNPAIWFGLLALLLLSGCGNRFEQQIQDTHRQVQSNVEHLKTQLDKGQLTNALLIKKYAAKLAEQKPDYADIATLMAKEASSSSEAFNSLNKRLANINLAPTDTQSANYNLQELQLINTAADAYEFNNGLADVVNTLASLSEGQLATVDVPAGQQSAAQVNALVGNPSYGNWQQDSSGRSFWEWYGMYALFSNVMGGGRNYYDSWSSRPNYSYYGQYGRNRSGSSGDVSRNYDLSQRHPSKYNSPSTATRARYSSSASRSSSYGGKSSSSAARSGSSGKTSSSSYGSSSRSSSFSSSRSSRSGK